VFDVAITSVRTSGGIRSEILSLYIWRDDPKSKGFQLNRTKT